MPSDNSIYDRHASGWWDENNYLHTLKTGINPARTVYFHSVLTRRGVDPTGLRVLDVGCGGGILSEEFSLLGCRVFGVDLSYRSIREAIKHSEINRLNIDYLLGAAEKLPFPAEIFDIVVCCDVLEHVRNLDAAISESARVLRPGGLYLFDTINRTIQSFFEHIFVAQEFPPTRFFPPGTHDWRQFIQPDELNHLLAMNHLVTHEFRGLQPGISKTRTALEIARLKRGQISNAEFGRRLDFQSTSNLQGSYIGFAVKES